MDDLEEKLGAILNNPQMMQQIMSLAQNMGSNGSSEENTLPPLPEMDTAMLQRISSLAQSSSIDQREQALLRALGSYLSKDRIGKLEKAMRAAKIAKIATATLGQRGALLNMGR
jgi:hypothetical protein